MGNGPFSSPMAEAATLVWAANATFCDRQAVERLIEISQSKLSLERDPDTSACLRKAVLVQNMLRRGIPLPAAADDDDAMAVSAGSASSVHSISSSSSSRSMSASSTSRRTLYRTGTCDGQGDDDNDDDDSDFAHVPEMLDAPAAAAAASCASPTPSSAARMAVEMVVAGEYIGAPLHLAAALEISPPPSPDALDGNGESEEEQMSRQMYAAEVARRASLVRKVHASTCAADGVLAELAHSFEGLDSAAPASPTKRPRLLLDGKRAPSAHPAPAPAAAALDFVM